MPVPAAILAKASWIWMASSRVGLRMTRADAVVRRVRLASAWMTGSTKARVLPVPVCAVATRLRSGQRRFDGQSLYGSRFGKALSREIALQESGEREFRESFHSKFRIEKDNRRANYRLGERGLRIDFSSFEYSTGSGEDVFGSTEADGTVPSGKQADAVAHCAEPHGLMVERRRELSDRCAIAGDEHGLALFHGADKLGELFPGLGNADLHGDSDYSGVKEDKKADQEVRPTAARSRNHSDCWAASWAGYRFGS